MSGSRLNVRKCMIVAVTTSAIGGQPAMFTTGLSRMIRFTPTAPVGFGRAACTEPQCAHAPIAITAAAPSPASTRISCAVRPPIVV
jgi:hypothetical protein